VKDALLANSQREKTSLKASPSGCAARSLLLIGEDHYFTHYRLQIQILFSSWRLIRLIRYNCRSKLRTDPRGECYAFQDFVDSVSYSCIRFLW